MLNLTHRLPKNVEIDNLRAACAYAQQKLDDANQKLHEALLVLAPFQIGDVVQSIEGKLAKIVSIEVFMGNYYHYKGVLAKKNGAWGTKARDLWQAEWGNATVAVHEEVA